MEVSKTQSVETLEEKLPDIVRVWIKARTSNWRDKPAVQKWREYQRLAESMGISPKDFIGIVESYARNEMGVSM